MANIKTRADFYKDTEYFCQYNNNPTYIEGKRCKKPDCVIRAFAMAADIEWLTAFDLLVENARKIYSTPNSPDNYEEVFKANGFERKSVKVEKGKKRMTLEGFCKTHKKGRYVVSVANHLTAVVDGVCYDQWNPANKCVYVYYELNR